jgi:hypothetical protein
MTWMKFFATPEDFPPLLERLLVREGRLFEVYSEPGHNAREFATAAATHSLSLGNDPDGSGIALHLALWVPGVMPRPHARRIELRGPKFPPGSWRETVEGCGLFWLQTGGLYESAVTASSIGWFTQRAAARQCLVQPGPDAVDWKAHSALAQALKRFIQRELAAASAGPHPVLPDALKHHRDGSRLIAGLGTKREFRVEAA